MTNEDSLILTTICARVSKARPRDIVAGSTKRKCCQCGEDCWIGPASVKYMEAETAKTPEATWEVICLDCVPPESIAEAELTPEVQAEIRSHLRRN